MFVLFIMQSYLIEVRGLKPNENQDGRESESRIL